VGTLALTLVAAANAVYWAAIAHQASPFEPYVAVTIPILWLFLLYAIAYTRVTDELQPYRTMFENARTGVCIVEPDDTLSLVNDEFARMCKLPRAQLEGKTKVSDVVAEEDRMRVAEYGEARLQGKPAPPNYELKVRDAEGVIHEVLCTVTPIAGGKRRVAVLQDIGEYKQAQAQANNLAAFQAAVMQTANVWITILDGEGRVTLWNQEAERISGYPADEAMGTADIWGKLYPDPKYRSAVRRFVRAVLSGEEEAVQGETRTRCKDGTYKTIHWHVTGLRDDGGPALGIIVIGRDVTQSKEAERRQLASLRVLESLNDSPDSSAMIRNILQEVKDLTGCHAVAIRLRRDGDYPYIESEGVSKDDLQCFSQLRVYRDDGQPELDGNGLPLLKAPYHRLVRGQFGSDLPFFTEAGSFWTNNIRELGDSDEAKYSQELTGSSCVASGSTSVALILLWSAGTVVGLLELGDRRGNRFNAELITYLEELASSIGVAVQRRMTDEALRHERNFSYSVVQNAQALMMGIDTDGNVTLFNNTAEQVTGYRASEVVGRKPWDVMQRDKDAASAAKPFREILAGESPKVFESKWLSKNGAERLITWRGTSLVDENGDVRHVIAIGLDITEHRQLESRMRQAQRMEAIATLAGGITHDFNNVLHAVLSNIELMRMLGDLNEEQLKKAAAIDEAVKHAAQITKQLTAMAAPERPEMGRVDLNRCVERVTALLGGVGDRGVTLSGELDPELPAVLGDATQVEQVVMNLCLNAVQALKGSGGVRVLTSREQATEAMAASLPGLRSGEQYVRLEVIDSGVGMTPETVEQIFDPFFTTRDDEGGTGLGLAVVYGIIQAHNGSISVQSEPGVGTTFTVHLPVASDSDAEQKRGESAAETGSETVMLVEDNDGVRANLTQLLSSLGYKVVEASTGMQAVEMFPRMMNDIDLVVLDVNMPKMNGLETFEKIRETVPDARGVLITGFVRDGLRVGDLPAGIMGVLRKPFTLRQLSRFMRNALAGRFVEDLTG